jgi:uncharacterized protein YceH (UPF0502 family)
VLNKLAERGMTLLLPKAAGTREPRWTHLLAGEPILPTASSSASEFSSAPSAGPLAERVAKLEAEVASLKEQFEEFRRQFQ